MNGCCRAAELRHGTGTSQQQGPAVQPASHHRPSYSTSPTTLKPPPPPPAAGGFDAARLIQPLPRPLPLPTAGSVGSVSTTTASVTAGGMAASLSNPLVGTMRPRTAVAQKATALPSSLLADADYMHRFRFSQTSFNIIVSFIISFKGASYVITYFRLSTFVWFTFVYVCFIHIHVIHASFQVFVLFNNLKILLCTIFKQGREQCKTTRTLDKQNI